MARIGLVLAGAGYLDGSEIQEAVLTLLALSRHGAQVESFAPESRQKLVVDHLTQQKLDDQRSIIGEAARIVRGKIRPLKLALASDMDALIIPGGFGVAQNLCDFATRGAGMQVDQDLESLILELHKHKKPIGAICIAPVILAKTLGTFAPKLTVGEDPELGGILTEWGAKPQVANADEVVIDAKNKLVSTPAFMLDRSLAQIELGISKLVQEVFRLV